MIVCYVCAKRTHDLSRAMNGAMVCAECWRTRIHEEPAADGNVRRG